jgi:hypothetical protein
MELGKEAEGYEFHIRKTSGKILKLRTSDVKTRVQWMDAIRRCVAGSYQHPNVGGKTTAKLLLFIIAYILIFTPNI